MEPDRLLMTGAPLVLFVFLICGAVIFKVAYGKENQTIDTSNASNLSNATTKTSSGTTLSTDSGNEEKVGERFVLKSNENQNVPRAYQIGVSTDKQTYKTGELVNITIRNEGTQPIHFSGADADIKIINLKTHKSFIPSPLLLTSLIPSGSSKTIVWNQQDYSGQQVVPDTYGAVVTISFLHGNSTFSILQK